MAYYKPKRFFSSKSFTGLSTEDHVSRSVNFLKNPEITLLLDHMKHEIASALKAGDERHDWKLLQHHLSQLEKDGINNNTEKVNWHFFEMGRVFSTLEANLEELTPLLHKGLHAIQVNHARNAPLNKRNIRRDAIREEALRIAKIEWNSNKSHSIRLSEMCDIVWSILLEHKEFMDVLPDNASGLKPWLREVAPNWAKKPGRPKAK